MPGFNIATFSAQIASRGLQRPNKFLLRIDQAPSFLASSATNLTLSNSIQAQGQATPSINAPPGLAPQPDTALQDTVNAIEYWVQAATLPGMQAGTRQLNRYGYGVVEKKPFSPVFNDATFTFVGDGFGINWQFLVDWLNTVVRFDVSRGIYPQTDAIVPYEIFYKSDYIANLRVITFNDAGTVTSQVVMREAFPISMQDLPLNWADNNQIMRIPITFAYMDWFSDTQQIT